MKVGGGNSVNVVPVHVREKITNKQTGKCPSVLAKRRSLVTLRIADSVE